jgi:hypothetical protein
MHESSDYISKVVMDVSFSSQEKNQVLQDEISRIFNEQLSSSFEKLLNEFSSQGYHLDANTIELQIGKVEYKRLDLDLPEKIIHSLRQELSKRAILVKPADIITGKTRSYLDILEHYLLFGAINSKYGNRQNLDEVLEYLLLNNAADLVALLKRHGEKENVRSRIAFQFEKDNVIKVLQALDPSSFNIITSYLSGIVSIQKKNNIVKAPLADFERTHHLFVLTYLLTRRGSVFNTRSFIKSQLKQMASFYNISYDQVLLMTYQSAKEYFNTEKEINLLTHLRNIFVEDYQFAVDAGILTGSEPEFSDLRQETLIERTLYFLEKGYFPNSLNHIDRDQISDTLDFLVKNRFNALHPFLTENVLLGRKNFFATALSQNTYQFLIHKLLPQDHSFVLGVLDTLVGNIKAGSTQRQRTELFFKEAILFAAVTSGRSVFTEDGFLKQVSVYLKESAKTSDLDTEQFFSDAKLDPENPVLDPLRRNLSDLVHSTGNLATSSPEPKDAFIVFNSGREVIKIKRKQLKTILEFVDRETKLDLTSLLEDHKIEFADWMATLPSNLKIDQLFNKVESLLKKLKSKGQSNSDPKNKLLDEEKSTIIQELKWKSRMSQSRSLGTDSFKVNALTHFLLTGKIPWWFVSQEMEPLRRIWQEVVHQPGNTISAFFKKNKDNDTVFANIKKLYSKQVHVSDIVLLRHEYGTSQRIVVEGWMKQLDDKTRTTLIDLILYHKIVYENKTISGGLKDKQIEKLLRQLNKAGLLENLLSYDKQSRKLTGLGFFKWLIYALNDNEKLAVSVESNKELVQNNKEESEFIKKHKIEFLKLLLSQQPQKKGSFFDELRNYLKQETKGNVDFNAVLTNVLSNSKQREEITKHLKFNELEEMLEIVFKSEFTFISTIYRDFLLIQNVFGIKLSQQNFQRKILQISLDFLLQNKTSKFSRLDYVSFVLKSLADGKSDSKTLVKNILGNLRNGNEGDMSFLPVIIEGIYRSGSEIKKGPGKKVVDKEKKLKDEKFAFVNNAGLILLWPSFTFYFSKLGITKDDKFVSKEAAMRGAYLLHYLATGKEKYKEHELGLNKFLCGLPYNFPIHIPELITVEEKALSNDLIETAISRWKILKNTTIQGLRESFLCRNGKLEFTEESVVLFVEKKSYDMLIDKLPWSVSTVRLPWLEKHLIVNWR